MSGDCPHGTYHVEISLKPHSTARNADVKENVKNFLSSLSVNGGDISLQEFDEPFLKQHVRRICIQPVGQTHSQQTVYSLDTQNVELHVYQLHEGGPGQEEITDEDLAAANHWLLPSANFDGVWESLIYDDEIKAKLLSYAATTLLFSDKRVDINIISWNRVILLHDPKDLWTLKYISKSTDPLDLQVTCTGPPGTGKTSLCKALAQKLSIRLSDRFSYGQLIEINSHSLFSKWFSESGKLVMKMFQKIQELIDDPEALVCVLIDEVESLTAARKSAMSGSEPSDSIRVVNAVLTQLDQIKSYPNVLILTTSNVTGAIDLAFVDRADIKQYIGPPSMAAIFSIYKSCINELMRVGIISPSQSLLDMRTLELMRFDENDVTKLSLDLMQISRESVGLSGRALRKIPFITQAVHIQKPTVTLTEYLLALQKAVKQQFQEQSDLSKD